MIDKRLLKVEIDHKQSRVKRQRIAFTLKGEDFLDGKLVGTWVNPITGKLQSIPNSEEGDFQSSNSGRFAKLQLSDGTTINNNASGSFAMMAAGTMHANSGIKFTDCENTLGIGFKTTTVYGVNQGFTCLAYAYDSGTDQDAILIDMLWATDTSLTGGGLIVEVLVDGRVRIYKDDTTKPIFTGSFSGGGYNPGSVRGGSYERPSDQFVMIRVEASQGHFLTLTSSLGGVCQFLCPWALTTYNDDGTVDVAGTDVIPAKHFIWYQPKGGGLVVAAPVIYGFDGPYAISPEYQLSEVPGAPVDGDDVLTARIIPSGPATVSLLMPDGVTAYDRTTRKCKVRVDFTDPCFISGVTGAYPRIAIDTPEPDGGPIDVTDYVVTCNLQLEDGPQGLSAEIDLISGRGYGDDYMPIPVPFLAEAELRPIRISLIPNPDDEDAPDPVVLLDGVGGVPEWEDGLDVDHPRVRIKVSDRMVLAHEAQCDTATPMDGLPLCRPIADGESLVSICLREGGIHNTEMPDLPDLAFTIDDTPGQHAGDWNFCVEVGDLWSDVLERGMSMAPQVIYGLKPTMDGTRAYFIDPTDSDPVVATFYRSPDEPEILTDPDYADSELSTWTMLYGMPHRRTKLPKEGNVVRVTGKQPGSGKGIQKFIIEADDGYESRDPEAPISGTKLGVMRTVAYGDPALTTDAMVMAVAQKLFKAITAREHCHTWPAFMRFKADGAPAWRGERVVLRGASPESEDETIRISAFTCEMQDESGGLLRDASGALAPVSLRITDYSGGAIVNLGGATMEDIVDRHTLKVKNGGIRRIGFTEIASTSMTISQPVPAS